MTIETLTTLVTATWDNPKLGVVALIGPPRGGKTRYLRLLAETLGRRAVWINPQCDAPEDVAGWPVRKGMTMSFTQPPNLPPDFLASEDPGTIILDEVDKARDENLTALLTLLNPDERRLRWTYLRPNVAISVAMNEPTRTLPEPLVERLLFVPWPLPGTSPFTESGLRSLARVAADCYHTPEIRIPQRKVTIGSLWMLEAWTHVTAFWQDEDLRTLVVRGLFPAEQAAVMLGRLDARESAWHDPVAWLERVSPAEAGAALLYAMHEAIKSGGDTFATWSKLLAERQNRSDETGEWQRILAMIGEHPELLVATQTNATPEATAEAQATLQRYLQGGAAPTTPSKRKGG